MTRLAAVQAGRRWVIERTHAGANQDGKLRWRPERRRVVVGFWLLLALAPIVVGRRTRRAWTTDRWDGRPAAAHDHRRAQAQAASLRSCTQRSGSHGERRGGRLSEPVDAHALRWQLFSWTSGSSPGRSLGRQRGDPGRPPAIDDRGSPAELTHGRR
jgi:hypothetical protein